MTKPRQSNLAYRPDIDGLRALAVLAVMLHHGGLAGLTGGFVGVDVFFVISGYLITRLIRSEIQSGTFTFSGFYIRRARRLLPALVVVTTVTLVAAVFVLAPSALRDAGSAASLTLVGAANFQFWLQAGYFEPEAVSQPFLHMWSLGVEEQFYLIWPLALVVLARIQASVRMLVVLCGVVAIASTLGSEWVGRNHPGATYYLLPFRAAELAAGAALAGYAGLRLRWLRHGASALGVILIVVPMFLFTANTAFPGYSALVPVGGTVMLIAAGREGFANRVLSLRPLVWMGLVSYSLYLIHWPLLALFAYAQGGQLGPLDAIGLLILSVGLAALSYRFVERPLRSPAGSRRSIQAPVAAGAAGLVMLVIAAGWGVSNGLSPIRPDHSPVLARALATAGAEFETAALAEAMDALEERNPDARRILVMGDSHSEAVFTPLARRGLEAGVYVERLVVAPGCPHLLGVRVWGNQGQSSQCNAAVDAALLAAASGDWDHIVLASRWGLYTAYNVPRSRREHGQELVRRRAITYMAAGDLTDDLARSRSAFARGLEETAALFVAAGKPLTLVAQVPPIGGNPERCIASQEDLLGVQNSCAQASPEQREGETGFSTNVLRARSELDGFALYEPHAELCRAGRCRIVDTGGFYYRDSNHMSPHGARTAFGPLAERVLTQVQTGR